MKRRHRSLLRKAMSWSAVMLPTLLLSSGLHAVTLTGIDHAPTPAGGCNCRFRRTVSYLRATLF